MSNYQTLTFRITGVSPLLLRNGQTADPLNQHAKSIAAISAKRKKVEADHRELSRLEWYACLYLKGGAPCIPSEMIEAAVVMGAKKEKLGPQAKAGIIVEDHAVLEYAGPRDLDKLYKDARYQLRVPVKVNQSRVIRTRPRFDAWSAKVSIKYLPSLLNASNVRSFLVSAGEQIGIGDWRPRFGRFSVAD